MFASEALLEEMDGLKKFAFKLTKSKEDAEDLAHNTILRALEKKHLFQDGTNLFSWASKIMYNLFVTDYRRKTKFEYGYDPEPYIQNKSMDAKQDTKMEYMEVSEAIQNLSKDHQEVLIFVCIKGMKYEDVATALNIPVGTVRSRLSRAREALKAELDANHIRLASSLPAAANVNNAENARAYAS